MFAVRRYFGSQTRDVYINDAVHDNHLFGPYLCQQFFAAEDMSRVGHQCRQNFKLLARHGYVLPIHGALLAVRVHSQSTAFENVGCV